MDWFYKIHILFTCLALPTVPFAADLPPPPGESERQLIREQQRNQALQKQQENKVDVHLETPQLIAPDTSIPEQESPCFVINQVQLVGDQSHRFQWLLKHIDDSPQPQKERQPRLGRCLGAQGINHIMSQMQNRLIKKGYITSRIVAGSQDLNSGILVLTLVPGRIAKIRFSGDTVAGNAFPMKTGDLLNLRDIEQALESIKRLPSVEADIKIAPADGKDTQPGDSDLIIEWVQRKPWRVVTTLDNLGTKSTGRYQATASLAYDNVFGVHDIANITFGHNIGETEPLAGESESYHLRYSLPYRYWNLSLNLSKSEYFQTVQGTFENYKYGGDSDNASLELSRLLYRDNVRKIDMGLNTWFRNSKNLINDTEVLNQRRRTGGIELALNYREFIQSATLQGSLVYRRGTGLFNALKAPEADFGEGESRPTIIKSNIQISLPFTAGKKHFQYSSLLRHQGGGDRLVAQDRFSIGGHYTIRGFDGKNTLLAERGWLLRNDLSMMFANGRHSLYLGLDYGHVSGPSTELLLGHHLAGAALGVKGSYKGLSYDIFAGTPISKPDGFTADSAVIEFTVNWAF